MFGVSWKGGGGGGGGWGGWEASWSYRQYCNCTNVVKEKESGRLKVAIILKFSVAKFKSKIRRCSNLTFRSLKVSFTFSIFRPFPSSRNYTYQNETKCKTFLVKMSFICMRIKNHFHINNFAVSLALKLGLRQLTSILD